jgi:hypothetical protein
LQSDVDAVVSAVDASRWDAAIAALDQLEADVASARLLAEYPTSAPRRSAPPDKEC